MNQMQTPVFLANPEYLLNLQTQPLSMQDSSDVLQNLSMQDSSDELENLSAHSDFLAGVTPIEGSPAF